MSFNLKNRLILFALISISLILFGSGGYILIRVYIEHHSVTLIDAIYFSVATISTLGHYPPGVELTSEVGKWFTIIYLIMGLAIIFGGIQTIIGPWLEIKINQAEHGWMVPLPRDEHVIICGDNEVSRVIVKKLKFLGIPLIVISRNPPTDVPHIDDDCTEIRVLKRANIDRASALLALDDDETNAMIALTARSLNEEINIIALSNRENSEEVIKKSGANMVISRKKIMSTMIDYWAKGDFRYDIFASGEGINIKEMVVKGALSGKKIGEMKFRDKYGTIIAIYRNGKIIEDPTPNFTLRHGDTIVYIPEGDKK
ncbi:MAG: potassium channel protein [Euryarchaeota archaeon]|nr:potassium channel protein [Euryarchaeota archaeon]